MRHQLVLKYVEQIARTGSLRSAAEKLGITPSALNRRILGIEEELGVEIFERHPSGLRPNIAGEILLRHIRDQLADMERVKSRIADLTGMRAGHINIATTREAMAFFLPELIKAHLTRFPAVSFGVNLFERGEAELSLTDNTNDIAIVFEPLRTKDLQIVRYEPQSLYCIMSKLHPLAKKARLNIYDCTDFPLVLPKRSEGIRYALDRIAEKVGITLEPAVETNSLELLHPLSQGSETLGFVIDINLRPELEKDGLVAVPLDPQGTTNGHLIAGYLRGRTLPVASARFLETIDKELARRFE